MTSRPSDEAMPRVSVIMTVFNAETYLAEAIDSVLAQSFKDFEFLIRDDGSTDGSRAILEDYGKRDRRIDLSSGANIGVAASANYLIARARGEFLARMDADDVCLPERFAVQVNILGAKPCLVAVGSAFITMDAEGREITPIFPPIDHVSADGNNLRGIVSLHQPTVMMRKAIVDQCGGYNEVFRASQDLDLWLRLAEVGQIGNIPDITLKYRIHAGSISGSRRQEQMEMCRRACEAAWQRRGVTAPFEYQHWRMEDTRASRREFYLRYGWQAWGNGFRDTWRHYAFRSLQLAPFSVDAWKLIVFGALRRPSQRRKSGEA